MIIIAPDKFKGSLSSIEICEIIENGISKILPQIIIKKFPFSDGGNGFLDIINYYVKGLKFKEIKIYDPLLKFRFTTKYLTGDSTAYIETAESSGIHLLDSKNRNPMHTSTYGLGQVIDDALKSGYKDIFIGLGGSSTTDGGTGLAHALGCQFYDIFGNQIIPSGQNNLKIHKIIPGNVTKDARIYAVADVQNCLYGIRGAAKVFSAQKGAASSEIRLLDAGLKNLAKIINKQFLIDVNEIPGSGAAGGAAAGLHVFANARIIDGAELIKEISGIENYLTQCKLLITGEGKMDQQTLMGKVCYKLAKTAFDHGVPVIGVTGKNTLIKKQYNSIGFTRIYQLKGKNMSEEEAINNARALLIQASIKIAKSFMV
jgi:glycerate 2-kinase